ncbi:hypothetical protein BH11ACT2_BH11ACT2_13410 [soil metagenome]
MPRHPSISTPTRKSSLIDEVIERLRHTALADVELGPFATRAELVAAVLEHIYRSEKNAEEESATGPSDLDTYFDGIVAAFDWNADPANTFMRRVAFEAAAFDFALVQPHYRRWLQEAARDLRALGLSEADAALESRVLNNVFLGFAYDLTVNHDPATTRAAFIVSLERFRDRIAHLVELAV